MIPFATQQPEPVKSTVLATVRQSISKWWIFLIAGLLLIAAGIWVINAPFQSYLALSWVFAVGMIGSGLADISLALFNRHSRRWVWWLIAGIADIIIGVFLFNNTLLTIILLPVVIGLWTLYRGVMAIGDVFHLRAYPFFNWHRLLITALAAGAMALFLLACPAIGIENIFLFSGLAFIATGIFRVYLSFNLRNLNMH